MTLEFYVDYCRQHLDDGDLLGVGMLLTALEKHSKDDYLDTIEFIDSYDPKAMRQIREAVDTHQSQLRKIRVRRK